MKINSKDTIAGFPVLKIRDLLRNNRYISECIVSNGLKVTTQEAVKAIDELLKLRLIDKNQDETSCYTYLITLQGNSLGNAKAVPSLSRAKADVLFKEFMQRVLEVNKKPKYLYKVTRILVFGSYITDAEFVNDIDIAFELNKKGKDEEKWTAKNDQQVNMAYKKGVRFNSITDDLFYTERVVLRYLKSRSPYISLHHMDDGILEIVETRQVFPSKRR